MGPESTPVDIPADPDPQRLRLVYDEMSRALSLRLSALQAQQQRSATWMATGGILLALLSAMGRRTSAAGAPGLTILALVALGLSFVCGGVVLWVIRVPGVIIPLTPSTPQNDPLSPGAYLKGNYVTLLEAFCEQIHQQASNPELRQVEQRRGKLITAQVLLLGVALLAVGFLVA